jgi:hypothetical protein
MSTFKDWATNPRDETDEGITSVSLSTGMSPTTESTKPVNPGIFAPTGS